MEVYERPEVLATYTIEELIEEATVCMTYGPGGGGTEPPPGGGG